MNIGDMGVPFIYQGEELIYPEYVKDGLVLHYDFSGMTNEDETKGIARDLSGNGNHGTLQNFNFTPESGYDKNKLLFDGVDDYLQVSETGLNPQSMAVVDNGNIYSYVDGKVYLHNGGDVIVANENLFVDSGYWRLRERSDDSLFFYLKSYKGKNNVIKNINGTTSNYSNTAERFSAYEFNKDVPFTVSFSLNYTGSKGIPRMYFGTNFGGYSEMSGEIVEGEWRTVYLTIASKEDGARPRFHIDTRGFDEVYMADFKIERGEVATLYNPSSNDYTRLRFEPYIMQDLLLYNRPLTAEEIAHNFEIEKERFGIE